MRRFILVTTIIMIAISLIAFSYSSDDNTTEETHKYLAAVEEMVDYYEENPYIFYNCNKKEWNLALNKLKKDIKYNKVDENDIFYRMQELSAILNNGHTYCSKISEDEYLPIKGKYFEDGFYIVIADSEHKQLLGKKLIAINGVKFEDVEKKYSKIISAENNQWVKNEISTKGFSKSSLKYLDLWRDINTITIKNSKGKNEKIDIDVVSQDDMNKIITDTSNYFEYNKNKEFEYNSQSDGGYPQYWYKLDKENRILYFQYNTCLDKNDANKGVGYEFCNQYPDFRDFKEMFTKFASVNRDSYDKIVVDVSNNTGGVREHIDYLISSNMSLFNSKKVYVIMTKNTFSAGVVAVDTLVNKCNAVMVGEETGGSVEMFAVAKKKSSILPIIYASGCKKIDVLNKANRNSTSNLQGAIPDIAVEYSINDVENGINPYYQAVVNN